MIRLTAATFTAVLFLLTPAARAADSPLKGLDEYITKAMHDWQVPGLAIAIVKDDAVFLSKGFGVRKLGETIPVTDHTLFAIGSTTKAFTATALAMLVEEGKINWDDAVTKHMPTFQLKDPYVTREITIRDLLAHRSGLNRHELVWYGAPIGRDEVLRRLRFAKPDWSFRSRFGYQNMMYLAAGQVIPAVTKKSWDDFIRERIFKPLNMTGSNTSVTAFAKGADVATPHDKIDAKVEVVPWRNIDNIGPAGSINSNVADMAQWIRFQLGEGVYNKQRLLSSGAVKEMHTPQTVIPYSSSNAKLNPHTHLMAYGMGWMVRDYRDTMLLEHGGGIDGMTAHVALLPEKKVGLVILTNQGGHSLPTALMYRVFDTYLGVAARDWSGDLLKTIQGVEKMTKEAQAKADKDRVMGTKPSLALDRYAGSYKDDLYGEVQVVKDKDKLVLHHGPSFVGNLEHWHYDTFRATWTARNMPKAFVTFRLDEKAKVAEVKVAVAGFGDLTLKRAPDKADQPTIALNKDQLLKFTGKYESKSPPVEVSVELVGDKLKLSGVGGSVALAPIKATRFKLDGVPIKAFVEFEVADGKVKSLTFEMEGQSVKLVRKK
jgi:CubicO group peptidase (beta-lactamase class C family)